MTMELGIQLCHDPGGTAKCQKTRRSGGPLEPESQLGVAGPPATQPHPAMTAPSHTPLWLWNRAQIFMDFR